MKIESEAKLVTIYVTTRDKVHGHAAYAEIIKVCQETGISGVTVTHVTLHNIDQIQRLGVHYRDTVVVERAGEVIPYVVQAVEAKRPKNARAIEPPAKCPSCGSKVEKEEGTPYIRCINRSKILYLQGDYLQSWLYH